MGRLLPAGAAEFLAIRDLLAEGAIGTVRAVQTTWRKPGRSEGWRWDPAQNRGGEFFETACHTFDVLDLLLGPATEASAVVDEGVHTVATLCRFGEVPASGVFAFGVEDPAERTVIAGTDGTLSFQSFTPSPIVVTTAEGVIEHAVADPPSVHGPLVAQILRELAGGEPCASSGRSALRTATLMEQFLA